MNEDDILYSLAKRVPDMERGFLISTSYGDICIDGGEEAEEIIEAVRALLERQLESQS